MTPGPATDQPGIPADADPIPEAMWADVLGAAHRTTDTADAGQSVAMSPYEPCRCGRHVLHRAIGDRVEPIDVHGLYIRNCPDGPRLLMLTDPHHCPGAP